MFCLSMFSLAPWPTNANFHVEPSLVVGKKVYINGTVT